ncbi:MAG: hypothetical protein IKY61_06060 [Thermoguttaceae bacterium]|nr:hypothetical protein [Thermoguttaceae bacterium]
MKILFQTKDGTVKFDEGGNFICDDAKMKSRLENLLRLWQSETNFAKLHLMHLSASTVFAHWLREKHGYDIEVFPEKRKPYPEEIY